MLYTFLGLHLPVRSSAEQMGLFFTLHAFSTFLLLKVRIETANVIECILFSLKFRDTRVYCTYFHYTGAKENLQIVDLKTLYYASILVGLNQSNLFLF